MTNEISTAVIVNVTGKTGVERKLSVVNHAGYAAKLALANASGAVGKAARFGAAQLGLAKIIEAASHDNYRPLAEYLAAQTGEAIVITNRATFQSLPDQFEQRIMKVRMSKSGGYREDKKTGTQVPNAALSMSMKLKAECVEIIAAQQAMRDRRAAEKAQQPAAITQ